MDMYEKAARSEEDRQGMIQGLLRDLEEQAKTICEGAPTHDYATLALQVAGMMTVIRIMKSFFEEFHPESPVGWHAVDTLDELRKGLFEEMLARQEVLAG